MSVNEFVDLSGVVNSGGRYQVYEELRKQGLYKEGLEGQELINNLEELKLNMIEQNPYIAKEYQKEKVENWPSDDAMSLQHMASGDCNLDMIYPYQFTQNENCQHPGGGENCTYFVEHSPILAGTMTGTIYLLDEAIQTFVFSQAGWLTVVNIGAQRECRVVTGTLAVDTATVSLTWTSDPGQHKIVVNYEWNYGESTSPSQVLSEGKKSSQAKSKQNPVPNASYIDYLVDQLSQVKDQLAQAEDKLDAIHRNNGGQKTIAEVELEAFNEYEKRFITAKDYMITKLDQYLKLQTPEELKTKTTVQVFDEAMES